MSGKKDLVIVESPSKTKKIGSYLGSGYKVTASVGHFMELKSIDEKTYEPTYKPMKEKSAVIKSLKDDAKKCGTIYIATDPDREGEAIAWHLETLLKPINPNIKRVTFNEITKKAVLDAMKSPRTLDSDLVNSAKARQVLDRIVGFKVSPLVWKGIEKAKSAGRVQSPALRLIVERQKEIDSFKPITYWTIEALLENSKKEEILASYYSKNRLEDKSQVDNILGDLKSGKYVIESVEEKETKKNPSPPFDTSSLQQTANSILGWSPKKTASVSQALYQAGYITYIRTDSFAISDDAMKMVRGHIETIHTKKFLSSSPIRYSKKSKSSVKEQGAHECIRPTNMSKPALSDTDQRKLYDLIYARFIASQMLPAVYDAKTYHIKCGKHLLKASGQKQKFEGFLREYPYSKSSDKDLAEAKKGEVLDRLKVDCKEHQTKPPPAYTQGSLVKELEDRGIGRPSTYPSIIDLIASKDRNYANLEKKVFKPTEIGFQLVDFLKKHFKDNFIEFKYTSEMEDYLDSIANGDKDWVSVLTDFDNSLKEKIKEARENVKEDSKTGVTCPKCGAGEVLEKNGRYGTFYSCSEWKGKKKGCQFVGTKDEDGNIIEKKVVAPTKSKHKCPDCGDFLVERKGKSDTFLGCSNYPKCKSGLFDLDGNKIEFKKSKRKGKKG